MNYNMYLAETDNIICVFAFIAIAFLSNPNYEKKSVQYQELSEYYNKTDDMHKTLLEQVKLMRQAQKEYFRTRQLDWLLDAQKRERAVDKLLQEIETKENNPKLL